MIEEKSESIRANIEKIAEVVAAYYASLLGNGVPESTAQILVKEMQKIWLDKILLVDEKK